LKDCADFYDNKHLNSDLLAVNFTSLSDDEFHRVLYEANQKLLTNYYSWQQKARDETLYRLYIEKDQSFRGFRQT